VVRVPLVVQLGLPGGTIEGSLFSLKFNFNDLVTHCDQSEVVAVTMCTCTYCCTVVLVLMKGDFIFQRHVKLRLRVLLNTIMFPEIEGGTLNQQKKNWWYLGKKVWEPLA